MHRPQNDNPSPFLERFLPLPAKRLAGDEMIDEPQFPGVIFMTVGIGRTVIEAGVPRRAIKFGY